MHLLLEAGQFAEVNPAPESPGELHAENLRHAGAPSNGGEQAKDLELERLRGLAAHRRDDVVRERRSLPDCVLRGRRIKLARVKRIRHERAVSQCPHAGEIWRSHAFVRNNAAPLQTRKADPTTRATAWCPLSRSTCA